MKAELFNQIEKAKYLYAMNPFVTKLWMANRGFDMEFLKKYWSVITGEKLIKPSIKDRLAEKIEQDLGLRCDPKSLRRIYSTYKFDLARWEGIAGGKSICSWDSMTDLVKKKEKLQIICETTMEIG